MAATRQCHQQATRPRAAEATGGVAVAHVDHTTSPGALRPLATALLDELDQATCRQLAERLRPYLAGQPNRMLNAREAAALVKVNPATLVKMAKAGRVPAVKFGREWRFRADQLEIIPQTGRSLSPAPAARPRPEGSRERTSTLAIRGQK
jgi:excisionase family DNA binding protein